MQLKEDPIEFLAVMAFVRKLRSSVINYYNKTPSIHVTHAYMYKNEKQELN